MALFEAAGNCGAANDWAEGGRSGNGDAVDEGENVGFGWAMPIFRRRWAKSGLMDSGWDGSKPSDRIAKNQLRVSKSPFQPLIFFYLCIGDYVPSFLVSEGWGLDGASGRGRVVRLAGGAEPGARAGNLRAPFWAALEPDAPITVCGLF